MAFSPSLYSLSLSLSLSLFLSLSLSRRRLVCFLCSCPLTLAFAAQLTLANVTNSPLRAAMANDELVSRVVSSPQLLRWLVSASHMDEQYWLNTCEVAAHNNTYTARLATVAHCMVITRTISADLRRHSLPHQSDTEPWTGSLWRCDMRSVSAHCNAVLDTVDEQLCDLTRRAHRALDTGSDMRELHTILMDWHRVRSHP